MNDRASRLCRDTQHFEAALVMLDESEMRDSGHIAHSVRSARTAKSVAARRAGTSAATRAARIRTRIVTRRLPGEWGFTPNNWVVIAYPVAIVILHIEWMTQRHYLDSARDRGLDPQFKSLLKHHWMEEAQHAKLDTLMVEALAEGRGPRGIEAAVEEYLEIGGLIDAGLEQQVEFDLDALTRATRDLNEEEKNRFRQLQLQANRWTYLGSAMTHERVLATLPSAPTAPC